MHETLVRDERSERPGNRSFGLVFAVVFTIVGFFPALRGGEIRFWALGVAGIFLLLALLLPAALAPLNELWFLFGAALHRIVSPIVLALLFYLTVAPIGLLMRALGKRPLNLSRSPGATSYWIVRAEPGPEPGTMKNQF